MDEIRVILVDDEPAARSVLRNLLIRCNAQIQIVAECADLPEAVVAINKFNPDVVFLDVQMPDYAGYEIVNFFDSMDFEIIFVTAYDQFALKAFELSAVDYIVKPIERIRLKQAIEKLSDKIHHKVSFENYQILLESVRKKELGKIIISELSEGRVSRKVLLIPDIIAIEAMGAYSKIYLKDDAPHTVSRNLKFFESQLPMENVFFRSHRSWILNMNEIIQYNPRFGLVTLTKGIESKLSKTRQELFESIGFSNS